MSQALNSAYINELEAFFIGRNDIINRIGNMMAHFMVLPGQVGIWYTGNFQRSTGDIYDYTGQGRTLTYNGANAIYTHLSNGIQYAVLDGTAGEYFSRADETDLDVQGNESVVSASNRGLWVAGWFQVAATGVAYSLISKWSAAAGNQSYRLVFDGTNFAFRITTDGSTNINVTSTVSVSVDTWYYVCGRFNPSTRISIQVDDTIDNNTTGIPATIFSGNQALEVGSHGGGTARLDGAYSIGGLGANHFNDATAKSMYQQTRVLYGK